MRATTRRRRAGFHVSVGGGLAAAVARAEDLGADALQIFPSNPRGWSLPEADPAGDEAFAASCAARGWPRYVHAPYLVNLASPDATVRRRSVATLSFALARAERLGAAAVVVHAGSAVGDDVARARGRAADAIRRLLDGPGTVPLAVELTAGGGSRSLARHVPDAAAIVERCGGHERLGVCLDTCHLWAAGVDWTSPEGLRHLRAEVRDLGPSRLLVLHVNDSLDPLGSARDRHAHLGEGTIGVEAFEPFLAAREWRSVPVILETPGDRARRRADLAAVRSMLDGATGPPRGRRAR